MTKEQLIKEFNEKFQDLIPYQYVKGGTKLITTREEVIAFLLSAFDTGEKNGIVIGRASGIEEVNKKIKDKKEMYEPAYEPEDQAIVSVLSELLTPSSSKDN